MSQFFWSEWARTLQHSRMKGFVLTFLESSGPLKLILSQLMLSSAPFVPTSSLEKWQAAAEMFEDNSESRKFAALLREEEIH
jgi:hypothetical protein